jgi:hypothetical protein
MLPVAPSQTSGMTVLLFVGSTGSVIFILLIFSRLMENEFSQFSHSILTPPTLLTLQTTTQSSQRFVKELLVA